METNYNFIDGAEGRAPVKAWTKGVQFETQAAIQVGNVARLPFIFKHVAVMPDVHWGIGATVGSVIATKAALVPAAVGVDLGCGMIALKTTAKASDLPDDLAPLRLAIERAVPHGRTNNGGNGDRGAWGQPLYSTPNPTVFAEILAKNPKIVPRDPSTVARQLCTLGTGNHFIEICLDEKQAVWIMLHSGSRGIGNKIGTYFIEQAKLQAERYGYKGYLPDVDLAWLNEATPVFNDYIQALNWAQDYARHNRELMLDRVYDKLVEYVPGTQRGDTAVNCHHNYAVLENHFATNVWITRKGAVRAREGDLGIIPGSMGARSYIVRGKGNPDSFNSCSHGAGRVMSRGEAKRRITLDDHKAAVAGVECRLDADVIDESPAAYKSIDAVLEAERDLVDVVATLKGVLCVKG